jgi:transketolase
MNSGRGGKITDIRILEEVAKEVRIKIVKMLNFAGSGHTGGSLSAADVAVAIYFSKMRFDPENPQLKERDRFILSKGHAAPLLYAIMAEAEYFSDETLDELRTIESPLQGHPCCKRLPGVEVSTGSLGQGLSVANGIALGLRLDKNPARVFCILGDGETQEGQVWEAAMTAAHYNLDAVCAVVDNNGLQIDGPVEEVMRISPLHEKWASFGWNVLEVNGHNMTEILGALDKAENKKGKPTVIIAHTVKGKGVSLFEHKVEYHGVAPSADELEQALRELTNG